jgi:hypothetical protein
MLTIDSEELYKLQLNECESKLHPLIHTSAPSESSTKCGSGFFRDEVWSM